MKIYVERHVLKVVAWALIFLACLAVASWLGGAFGACAPLPSCESALRTAIPTMLQSASLDAGTTASASLILPGDSSMVGDIFVSVRAGNHTNHNLSVTDDKGTVYLKLRQLEPTNDTVSLALFHAQKVNLGANTITVTDATSPGTLRIIAQKYVGVGPFRHSTTGLDGTGSSVTLPPPPPTDVFRFVTVTASNGTSAIVQPAGLSWDSISGKLFALGGPSSIDLSPPDDWGVITADFDAGTSECATPTPVLAHDPVPDADVAGYTTYYRMPGGSWNKLVDQPCWVDYTEGTVCRGVTAGIGDVLQRDCPSCTPFELYEFSRKAYDHSGNYSLDYSNVVSVCFSPICTPPGPCN